jgi:DNA-binding NtrC family response regulator
MGEFIDGDQGFQSEESSAYCLEVCSDGQALMRYPIDRSFFSVGRNMECHCGLGIEEIAPVQFSLRQNGSNLVLRNHAEQGTMVEGECVLGECEVAVGARLQVGGATILLKRWDEKSLVAGSGRTLSMGFGWSGLKSEAQSLELKCEGRAYVLGREGVSVGACSTNALRIDKPYISGLHAELFWRDGRYFVRDLDSRNGVFLGERKIVESEVVPGNALRLGNTTIQINTLPRKGHSSSSIRPCGPMLVGRSAVMEKLREKIRKYAQSEQPVIITGETGTGKEVVAQLLHHRSKRAGQRYEALNCGALSREFVGSELFGHEKGAFTGATALKRGLFELADRGTLFLDEIGELPLDIQPYLLRVVEYGHCRRLGGVKDLHFNTRLVVATNRDLEVEVKKGRFREDLFHRIYVLVIKIPPLRKRTSDIPDLVRFFVDQMAIGDKPVAVSDKALHKLKTHSWPGNVRELRNVLARALCEGSGKSITMQDIIFSRTNIQARLQTQEHLDVRTLELVEKDCIEGALRKFSGSRSLASEALGISRSTMRRKMGNFSITIPDTSTSAHCD